jgi:hypothetical protein
MPKNDYTIKTFRRGRYKYVGIWRKGHRGFFSYFRYSRKEHKTVKDARRLMTARKEKPEITEKELKEEIARKIYLYRQTYTRIFYYANDIRIGQLRIEAFSFDTKSYPVSKMRNYWKKAFNVLWNTDNNFRKMYQRYKADAGTGAYEQRIITKEEMRGRSILNVYADLVGFGMRTAKTFIIGKVKQRRY